MGSPAGCLTLASLEVLVQIVDFLEDLVITADVLVWRKVVRALAGVDGRHRTSRHRARTWTNILSIIKLIKALLRFLLLLALVNHRSHRFVRVRIR